MVPSLMVDKHCSGPKNNDCKGCFLCQMYLNGGRGDLEVMELPKRAVSVNEIGGGQLVESFKGQRTSRTVGGTSVLLTSAELAFVHENRQGLLA